MSTADYVYFLQLKNLYFKQLHERIWHSNQFIVPVSEDACSGDSDKSIFFVLVVPTPSP